MAITKKRGSTRSGLFLTELIIAILFFSLASAICTQLFVKAYSVSNKSRDLSIAINQIQAAAESFKASDGSFDGVLNVLEGSSTTQNKISIFFDNEWNKVLAEPPSYELVVKLDGQSPVTATISVFKILPTASKELIYEIETKKYIPN